MELIFKNNINGDISLSSDVVAVAILKMYFLFDEVSC